MPDLENWERQTLEKLAFSALQEQRRARHWSIFFKLLTLTYLFILLFVAMGLGKGDVSLGSHTALVNVDGVIGPSADVSAEKVISGLQDAFKDQKTKGVILRINSPGGSPVQAGYINDEIRRLRAKNPKIPIYAVVEDICASGGYYVAAATDKIYVDKASLVGSIGVLMDGFGFTGTMEKFGVERRLITSGDHKGFMDPFSPINPEHEQYAKTMLTQIHQQFIDVVRQGRGSRLKETPETFSGLIWTGQASIEMGLADALGSAAYVAREVIKAEDIVDFTPQDAFTERFVKRLGVAMAKVLGNPSGAASLRLQ